MVSFTLFCAVFSYLFLFFMYPIFGVLVIGSKIGTSLFANWPLQEVFFAFCFHLKLYFYI